MTADFFFEPTHISQQTLNIWFKEKTNKKLLTFTVLTNRENMHLD